MRHRPRVVLTAFSSPLGVTSGQATASFPSACCFKQSPILFPSRRVSRPYLCMVSNADHDNGETSEQDSASASRYGSIPPQSSTESQQQQSQPAHPEPEPTDRRLIIAGAGLLALFSAGSVAAATGALNSDTLVSLAGWFETLGPSAVYLYATLYFILELVAVPALPLTLGSGYLFGLVKGTAAVSVASTLAAAASFVIARYGLRDSVTKLAMRYPRFRAMDRAIGKQGFKFVFLLRLSPLLPFAISNYLYGLTSVNLPEYVLGSWLGMLPGTIAYVSAGAAVGALTDLNADKSQVSPVLLLIGAIATVAALTFIGKIAAEAVRTADEEEVPQNN